MIRIKRSEYTSQLSTDIGLIYFHCKGQERGSPNATLDGTLSGILCLDFIPFYVWTFEFDSFFSFWTIMQEPCDQAKTWKRSFAACFVILLWNGFDTGGFKKLMVRTWMLVVNYHQPHLNIFCRHLTLIFNLCQCPRKESKLTPRDECEKSFSIYGRSIVPRSSINLNVLYPIWLELGQE